MDKDITELKTLRAEELESLYIDVVNLRKTVLDLVQKYGYSAETLVSRTFEHEIERWFGFRILQQKQKEKENK